MTPEPNTTPDGSGEIDEEDREVRLLRWASYDIRSLNAAKAEQAQEDSIRLAQSITRRLNAAPMPIAREEVADAVFAGYENATGEYPGKGVVQEITDAVMSLMDRSRT